VIPDPEPPIEITVLLHPELYVKRLVSSVVNQDAQGPELRGLDCAYFISHVTSSTLFPLLKKDIMVGEEVVLK
jgi:hypothetical protein